MRDQHQRGTFARVQIQQQIQHMLPVRAVEVARRLIRHQDGRRNHERASQRHTLLLAAGELHRIMIQPVFETDARQKFASAARIPGARQLGGQQHVLLRRERRNELIGLEHEADLSPPHQGQLVFRHAGDVDAIQNHRA